LDKLKKVLFSILLLFTFTVLTACGGDEEVFKIGVIPAQTEGEMEEAMDKLQAIIEEKLNREVDLDVYPDYNGVVEAMNYDKIDMAFLGPLTYVIANNESNAQAIVTQLINGEPFYHSYLITHMDNEQKWDSLDDVIADVSNVRFAFGDPSSTSGSLIPSIELKNRGVFLSEDNHKFKTIQYTGSHDATALAVQNKTVDIGAIDSAIFHALADAGKIDGVNFKVIWKSEPLFQYPWAVHGKTDEETKKLLQEAFQNIKDPIILDAFGASGFTTASDEDYEAIRKAAIDQGVIEGK
jgi:phosphonate transport system substrate-binding protein